MMVYCDNERWEQVHAAMVYLHGKDKIIVDLEDGFFLIKDKVTKEIISFLEYAPQLAQFVH